MGTLEIALGYLQRGWSVIQLKAAGGTPAQRKKPNLRTWKPFQNLRANESQVRQWFDQPKEYGIAVVLGDISGSLVCRDFDNLQAYKNWASHHPALAKILPTVETSRGRHVYCRTVVPIAELRARGKLATKGIYNLNDGEFRIDGGFVVLPPTLHPSGKRYRWLIEPTAEFPQVDFDDSGFMRSWMDEAPDDDGTLFSEVKRLQEKEWDQFHYARVVAVPRKLPVHEVTFPEFVTERTESTERDGEGRELLREQRLSRTIETTEAIVREGGVPSSHCSNDGVKSTVVFPVVPPQSATGQIAADVEQAIMETLPKEIHTREKCLFEFGRSLKAIPRLVDASAKDLRDIVREWHKRALPTIGTKPFEETRAAFDVLWPKIKFAKGQEPMEQLVKKAFGSPFPPETDQYESLEMKRLAAVCRELQRTQKSALIYLSARTAGKLLGINQMQAWRYLKLLQDDDILKAVETGSNKNNKATRFRYLGVL